MAKFSFLSLFSSKKEPIVEEPVTETEEMIRQKLDVLRWITMTNFTNIHHLEVYKNNPVMVIEDAVTIKRAGEGEESKNVFFFQHGRPSVSYEGVDFDFDANTSPAELQQFIENSKQWGRRVTHTWNAAGLLTEIDFASPEKSWSNDKFTYGADRLMTQRDNVEDWPGESTALYTYLPHGKGLSYRYSDDASTGEDIHASIEGDQVVIRRILVDSGRNLSENRYYYNKNNVVTKDEFIENGQVVRYIDYSLDAAGNEVLKNDSENGTYKTKYEYDEKGNYTYRKLESQSGYVEETRRVIKY